jgi:hypothetical protein
VLLGLLPETILVNKYAARLKEQHRKNGQRWAGLPRFQGAQNDFVM